MGPLKVEAVVVRSLRYGEADRILHLYTPTHGRFSAIAKGVRRTRSRFGGRLELFVRVRLLLHEGRSELLTVTGADTIASFRALRDHAATLDAAASACDAVARLFPTGEPHPEVFRLLVNELALLDSDPAHARAGNGLAFRLKLLLAAGIVPQLSACAACGATDALSGFSGAAGGVVCAACEAGAFSFSSEAYAFMVGALGSPLARAPEGSGATLRQVERAIRDTAAHHGQVRLRPLPTSGAAAAMTGAGVRIGS